MPSWAPTPTPWPCACGQAWPRWGTFCRPSDSNQQFPILPNAVLDRLRPDFHWEQQGAPDAGHTIRLVTSWATREEAVSAFLLAVERAPGRLPGLPVTPPC